MTSTPTFYYFPNLKAELLSKDTFISGFSKISCTFMSSSVGLESQFCVIAVRPLTNVTHTAALRKVCSFISPLTSMELKEYNSVAGCTINELPFSAEPPPFCFPSLKSLGVCKTCPGVPHVLMGYTEVSHRADNTTPVLFWLGKMEQREILISHELWSCSEGTA